MNPAQGKNATMIVNIVLTPLLLGLSAAALMRAPGVMRVAPFVAAGGLFSVYLLSEGLPPFPPISSKHKIAYLFALFAILSLPVGQITARGMRMVFTIAMLSGASVWINWRWLKANHANWPDVLTSLRTPDTLLGLFNAVAPFTLILLAISAAILAAYFSGPRTNSQHNGPTSDNHTAPFAWPYGGLVTMIALSLVSLLSGYLGVGLIAGALSAYLGGILLFAYIAALFSKSRTDEIFPSGLSWLVINIIGLLSISLARFATNLNPIAFFFIMATFTVPMISAHIPAPRAPILRPIPFVFLPALPAACAVMAAYSHF